MHVDAVEQCPPAVGQPPIVRRQRRRQRRRQLQRLRLRCVTRHLLARALVLFGLTTPRPPLIKCGSGWIDGTADGDAAGAGVDASGGAFTGSATIVSSIGAEHPAASSANAMAAAVGSVGSPLGARAGDSARVVVRMGSVAGAFLRRIPVLRARAAEDLS